MLLALTTVELVAVIGAFLGGIGGIISAWASLYKAKHEGDDECEQKLKLARKEAEMSADELHSYRMRKASEQ